MGEKKNNQINRATVIYISSMILFATVAFLSAFAYKYYLHYKWIKARGEVVRCRNQEIERQILWQYGLEEGDTIWTNTVNDEWFLVLEGEKVDDLADLENFQEIERLILRETGVTDLTPLKALKKLRSLYIYGGKVTNLEPIMGLEGLKHLEFTDLPIKSLEPLRELKALNYLHMENLLVEDLSPLKGLSLTDIRIKDMPVTDISVLETVTGLEYFTMERTPVKDVSLLGDLKNINSINIVDCPVGEIGDFDALTIEKLEIVNTNIDRLPALPDSLRELTLINNKIDNFTQMVFPWKLKKLELCDLPPDTCLFPLGALDVCPGLNSLTIKNAGLQDIEGISKICFLRELDVSGNQIADISELEDVTDMLCVLNLSGNPVRDFGALGKLKDLEILNASQIDLRDEEVQGSFGHIKVEELILSGCDLNHVDFLQNIQHLRKLDVSNNQIEDWECLKNLKNLVNLDLSRNQVKDITPVAECEKLHTLDFSYNQITDISVFANRKNLYELRINNNQIVNISMLADTSNLEILDLSGNPLSSIEALKGLKKLKWLNLSEINLEKMEEEKGRDVLTELMKGRRMQMDEFIIQNCGLQDLEFMPANIRIYKLDASYNQIRKLPKSRKEQEYFQILNLCGNPITDEDLEEADAFEIGPGIYRVKCYKGWQVKVQEDSEFIWYGSFFMVKSLLIL